MDLELKQEVTEALNQWIDEKNPARSATKLAEKSGVNSAYISRIKNGQYEMQSGASRITVINDSHFYKLAEAIGMKFDDEFKWDYLDSYVRGQAINRRVQKKRERAIIDGDSGQGKSFNNKWYNRENDYVMYVECTRNMTGKSLILAMCDKLGIELPNRATPYDRLEMIKKVVTNRRGYLLIFDQVGKNEVKPSIYGVLMDIANAVDKKCGMIITGYKVTEMLQNYYDKHVPGYRQFARRFLANAFRLPDLTPFDIEQVCVHEGITNRKAINALQYSVRDLDMLVQYVGDIKEWQARKGVKISGEEVSAMFNIKYTSLKAA